VAGRIPKARKPTEQLRRRNRPEEWTVLPAEGCALPAPKWPVGAPAKAEADLWRDLWRLPIAAWWHEQHVALTVIARYVKLSLAKPEHASVATLERELGLTPASMLRLRLVVEAPEVESVSGEDPYADLRTRLEAVS
jgi:hypothetical protein